MTVITAVAIRPEPGNLGDVEPLIDAHRRIEAHLISMQSASGQTIAATAAGLDRELQRHLAVVQHYIQPLFDRVRPDVDANVTWLPERHERHAIALLQQLRAQTDTPPAAADEIARNVRIAIIELEERILPDLTRSIGPRTSELLLSALLYSFA